MLSSRIAALGFGALPPQAVASSPSSRPTVSALVCARTAIWPWLSASAVKAPIVALTVPAPAYAAVYMTSEEALRNAARVSQDYVALAKVRLASAKADFVAQADPNADSETLVANYGEKVNIRNFDGKPALTEMDALVAYLQVLGTMVDFSTFQPVASR